MTIEQQVNRYVLGTKPRLKIYPLDTDGVIFVPSEIRLSIKEPDGQIITYSGADLTTASGFLYYYYNPETVGYYEYETWVKDGNGLEAAATKGFEIYDNVFYD